MKICVVGAGFTGLMTALSVKRHCPQHTVVMIDSPSQSKNVYFGESAPPQAVKSFFHALKIDPSQQNDFLTRWLIETRSTLKYNFKWQDFLKGQDPGWFSGLAEMPSSDILLDPHHSSQYLNPRIARPSNEEYKIYDLWYELYLQGRRTIQDWAAELNSFYWFCQYHSMDAQYNGFLNGHGSLHINSVETGDWLLKNYGTDIDQIVQDHVQRIEQTQSGSVRRLHMNSGTVVEADFFIDCTGFNRLFAKHFDLEFCAPATEITHNTTIITNQGYTENIDREMHPYTVGYGMQNGWTFGIPLLNRRVWGYVFDSNFATEDQALHELRQLAPQDTEVADPFVIKWSPGNYQESWRNNFALVGLSSGFVDPFDANVIALQFRQIFKLIEFFSNPIKNSYVKHEYSTITNRVFEKVSQRLEFHQGLAPRDTSEYWRRNHDVAKRKHLAAQALAELDLYEHSTAAEDTAQFIPYFHHLYLTETLYYGIDMSKRCRKSSADMLNLADEYFKNHNRLNKMRAKMAPTMRQWYQQHGIDFNNLISFRK
jgi:flavin-dependent dehydrogenase